MRASSFVVSLTLGAASAALAAGCAGQSSPSQAVIPAQQQAAAVTKIPVSDHALADTLLTDTSLTVGVRLETEKSKTSKKYGKVLGYFKGTTSLKSQVVMLAASQNVVFENVDKELTHTASFLGDATKKAAPWPSSFNGSSTQSTAGTAIGTTNFSTGPLEPGKSSLVYTTGSPGFYMIGCAFHYDSSGMRTVVIVQ
jgi:plastocyanin